MTKADKLETALREILEWEECPTMPCPHWNGSHVIAHRALAGIETGTAETGNTGSVPKG